MKRFNQAKWEALQQKKADLHKIFLSAREDIDFAREEYTKSMSIFFRNYKSSYPTLDIIQRDQGALSAAEIEAKLNKMRTNWPVACVEFGVTEGFYGKHELIELYRLMLERQKLIDRAGKAAGKQQEFGACFNVLNDFASRHGQGDHSRYKAVSNQTPIY